MTFKGCSPYGCAVKNVCIESALPTIVYFSYAVILWFTAGQSSGKGHLSAAPVASAQTKQPNHSSSVLPTRQLLPVVRLLEYELLKTNPTLQNNSHIVNFASAYTLQPADKESEEVILFSQPTSALSSWNLRYLN